MPLGAFRSGFIGALVGGGVPAETYYNATDFGSPNTGNYWGVDSVTNNISSNNKYITVSMLLKFGQQTGFNRPFDIGIGPADGTEDAPRIFCYVDNSAGKVTLRFQGASQREYQIATDTGWADNNWHHFMFIIDGDSASNSVVYVDGVDDTTATKTHTGADVTWTTFDLIGLGTDYDREDGDFDFDGQMAYLWVDNSKTASLTDFWDSAESRPYQLSADGSNGSAPSPLLYFYGDTSTISTNNGRTTNGFGTITFTATGSPTDVTDAIQVTPYEAPPRTEVTANGDAQVDTAQSKFGGASLLLDGTGDYLEAQYTSSALGTEDDFTWEGWFRITAFPTTIGDRFTLANSGSNGYLQIEYEASGPDYDFSVRLGTDFYVRFNVVDTSTSTWHHIALVKQGSNYYCFQNGTQCSVAATAGTMTSSKGWASSSALDTIGRLPNNTAFDMDGHIDEVRLSNVARYTTGFTPSTTPFVNDENTVYLLHMDGTDGSTTFIDDDS